MSEEEKKRKIYEWQKNATTQFLLRFSNDTGIPDAIKEAAHKHKKAPVEYIKAEIVSILQKEGFLERNVVLDKNAEKHRKRIQRLKEYIAIEEAKNK